MGAIPCPPAKNAAKDDLGNELGSCLDAVHLTSFCGVSLGKEIAAWIVTSRRDPCMNRGGFRVRQRDKARDAVGRWGVWEQVTAETVTSPGGEEGQAHSGCVSQETDPLIRQDGLRALTAGAAPPYSFGSSGREGWGRERTEVNFLGGGAPAGGQHPRR